MNPTPLGVGLIGAGPVVQAIHLPTLLRLQDRLVIRSVMDIDLDTATVIANRAGAKATTSVEDLLADPDVDIVAICSPAQFHASQVIKAIEAGKKAVLCEKPFATSRGEAELIIAAAQEANVPLFVGAMHTMDPAWTNARQRWGNLVDDAHTVRSRILLPKNDRYEDWATELLARPVGRPQDKNDPDVQAAMFIDGILGLAIHNLPLVREFLPDFDQVKVEDAQLLEPWGYLATLRAGNRLVQLTGVIHDRWNPEWTLEVLAADASLRIDFPPSFVHAGSGTATLRHSSETTVLGPYPHNGYEVEWNRLADAVHGDARALPPVQSLVDDLTFAVDIANQAADLLLGKKAA